MEIFEFIRQLFVTPITFGTQQLPFSLFELLLNFILPTVIIIILYKVLRALIQRWVLSSLLKENTKEVITKWSGIILRFTGIGVSLILFTRLFGSEIPNYFTYFILILQSPFIKAGSTEISITTLLLAIPVFYGAAWVAKGAKNFFEKSVLNRIVLDDSKRFSISTIIKYSVMGSILLLGLSIIGIDFSSLAVLFGVLGIGLGFGLQNMVANFFAGLVILFTRPVKEGDRILVNDELDGIVVSIRVLSTIINTYTNETIIIPNSLLVNNSLHNYSFSDKEIVIVNTVEVSYLSDLDQVIEILKETGSKNPYRSKKREITVRVESFNASGIEVQLYTWIQDVAHKLPATSWTNLEIWRDFKTHSISIPFPQMDVHFHNPNNYKTEPKSTPSP